MSTEADREELNRDPPAPNACVKCGVKSDNIQRCATCKNAFYCGRTCQTKAWKKHKLGCSLLPLGQMAYPAKMSSAEYQELDGHVRRIALIVREWSDSLMARSGLFQPPTQSPLDYPFNSLIRDITLPAKYSAESYSFSIPGDPFRSHALLIIRLFAIHWVAWMRNNSTFNIKHVEKTLSSSIASFTSGPHKTSNFLWLPKLLCQPGELSPMEYVAFSKMMFAVMVKDGEDTSMLSDSEDLSEEQAAYEIRYMSLLSFTAAFF